MNDDKKLSWSDIVRLRLLLWFRWSNGNHINRSVINPIAAMIRVAAGELPGDDISVPRELTPEIEVTDKAVAWMKRDQPILRRLLIDAYLHGRYIHEMAMSRHWTEEKTKMELWRAESVCGRYMITVEKDMRKKGLAIPKDTEYHRSGSFVRKVRPE